MRQVFAGSLLVIMLGVSVATAQPVRGPAEPPIAQTDRFDCGVAALATLLGLQYGREVVPELLISATELPDTQYARIRERGYSLYELALMARAVGATTAIQRLEAQLLPQLPLPGLVYLALPTGPHFSVVIEVAGDKVALADPSQGFMVWSKAQFLAVWAPAGAGYVLTVTADPDASA